MSALLPRRLVLAVCGVALLATGVTGAVLLRGDAPPVATGAPGEVGVRRAGPVASGQEPLPAEAVSGPTASGPAAGPRGAGPSLPPAGRNPFVPLAPGGSEGGSAPTQPDPPSTAAAPPTPGAPGQPPADPGGAVPGGPAPGTADAVLGRGARGPDVRAVQQRMRDRGWRIAVDGRFGPQTERVVTAFQRRRGLVVDGLVGPATRAALSPP